MRIIVALIAIVAGAIFFIRVFPVLGFQYTFWQIHQITDKVPESELIDRTKDIPETKAFVEKYENARMYIDTDFHIAVIHAISECELTGQNCNEAHPNVAYLDTRISLDTGYPERSIFWCGSEGHTYPLGDKVLVQNIKNC